MPLCAFRSSLLVKVLCNPWHFMCADLVGLYPITIGIYFGFYFRLDEHSQDWEKTTKSHFANVLQSLHAREEITITLKVITGFAKPLGALGMGQFSSQSSCCCPSGSYLLRGQNIMWYCRDRVISRLRRRKGSMSHW